MLVGSSIATPRGVERIRRMWRASRFRVVIGACATAGGIQALPSRTVSTRSSGSGAAGRIAGTPSPLGPSGAPTGQAAAAP